MLSSPLSTRTSILFRANIGILTHKSQLMNIMESKFGPDKAKLLYKAPCPLVGASIGQHVRHSMDHIELAVLLASTTNEVSSIINNGSSSPELHYDLRIRGGTLEHDMGAAKSRVESCAKIFRSMLVDIDNKDEQSKIPTEGEKSITIGEREIPVNAFFFLTADRTNDGELALPSTISRELGFVAHHAIHHMALIRIIALNTVGLKEDELPSDFGRAPSTIRHDSATDVKSRN